jgi:hypothetical protein
MSTRVHHFIENLPDGYHLSIWAIEDRRKVTLRKAGQHVLDITSIYRSKPCREALKRLPDSLPELRVMLTVAEI